MMMMVDLLYHTCIKVDEERECVMIWLSFAKQLQFKI